jgi:predicted nucleic acid-binding protein
MNQPKVYIETSVISYLTARPSRDIVIAGHQQVTCDWWETATERFHLVTSQLVIQEASVGDKYLAEKRLDVLEPIELLAISTEAIALAELLINKGPIPKKAVEDALHIAIAVTNGIDYLVTWNCKHIANAIMRSSIEKICRSQNYEPVTICTPEQLLGE